MNEKGFTLLETVVSLGVFMVVSLGAMNLLIYGSNLSGGIMVRQELLENGRAAMDFILSNAAKAEKIQLTKRANGSLHKLVLTETDNSGALHDYIYQFDNSLPIGAVKYHRLEMGGNELASFIKDVRVTINDKKTIMTVKIITDDRLNPLDRKSVQPVILMGKVSIQYKEIL